MEQPESSPPPVEIFEVAKAETPPVAQPKQAQPPTNLKQIQKMPRPVYRPMYGVRRHSTFKRLPSRSTASAQRFFWPAGGYISSDYGHRSGRMHQGVDLCNPTGTKILAAQRGVVKKTGWSGAYGIVVDIDHGNGLSSRYAHCSKVLVKAGDRVNLGSPIALVGSTGRTTAPHVHFEIRQNGSPIDPLPYMTH